MSHDRFILQYEFFNVKLKEMNSLSDVLKECGGRILDNFPLGMESKSRGTSIKTTFRILDKKDAQMVQVIKIFNELEGAWLKAVQKPGDSIWSRMKIERELRKINKEKQNCLTMLKAHAIEYLILSIKDDLAVAVENSDRSFRKIADDERHELFESIVKSDHFMLFSFQPNDIYADRNKSAGSISHY